MGFYSTKTVGKNVIQFVNGQLNYLFGFRDSTTAPFIFAVSNISVSSNVVTATGVIGSGGGGHDYVTGASPIPVANAIIGVKGLSSANGNVNVDPTTIVSANINANIYTGGYGNGTITYNASNTGNLAIVKDGGIIVVQPFTYPDVLKTGGSIELNSKFSPDQNDSSKTYLVQTTFPQSPNSCNVVIQVANDNYDSQYANVLNEQGSYIAAQVIGNVVVQSTAEFVFKTGKFIRAYVSDATSNANATSSIITTIFG